MVPLVRGPSNDQGAVSALGSGRACLTAFIASAQRANVRRFHGTMCEPMFIPRSCVGGGWGGVHRFGGGGGLLWWSAVLMLAWARVSASATLALCARPRALHRR